eukprot:1728941-Karenia_brevis.AAC.1
MASAAEADWQEIKKAKMFSDAILERVAWYQVSNSTLGDMVSGAPEIFSACGTSWCKEKQKHRS